MQPNLRKPNGRQAWYRLLLGASYCRDLSGIRLVERYKAQLRWVIFSVLAQPKRVVCPLLLM